MKTNYQMLTELNKAYSPKTGGVVTMSEIRLIEKTLCLDEMNELQLRNLRDFTVLCLDNISQTADDPIAVYDKISAITSVIDNKLWNIGAEV